MKIVLTKSFILSLLLISTLATAQEQEQEQRPNATNREPKTLEFEQPFVVHARKPLPYEIVSGTVIQMLLLSTEIIPIAQVSTTVFDAYGNAAIPAGSRMLGKYIGKRGDRNEIKWDGLQIPELGGTLRIDPPLQATMPNGSAGIIDLELGRRVATITVEPFIVPHRR